MEKKFFDYIIHGGNFVTTYLSGVVDTNDMGKIGIAPDASVTLSQGVTMRKRGDTIFLMNFSDEERIVTLPKEYKNVVSGETVSGDVTLPVCGYMVIE